MVTRHGQRTPDHRGAGRPPRRHRSAGEVLAGIGAIAALAALLAGVPAALLVLFGSPLPDELPSADVLTRRIGPSALLGVLVALVWLAWLQFAACVVVELYAGVRGVGVPARVPLAGGTQSLVHRLVVAALLLFTATTTIMPALTAAGPAQRPPAQTQSQEFRPVAAAVPERAAPDPGTGGPAAEPLERTGTTKIYRVRPPEGRHHESLWEIAEKCLGDGRRYKEIFALNKGRTQPDGTRLTIASLIRPGWILELPADAKGAKVIPVEELDEYFRHGRAVPDRPAKPERPPQPAPPPSQAPPTAGPTTPSTPAPTTEPTAPPTTEPTTAPAPRPTEPAQGAPRPAPSQSAAPRPSVPRPADRKSVV